jgi:hypothetical protein
MDILEILRALFHFFDRLPSQYSPGFGEPSPNEYIFSLPRVVIKRLFENLIGVVFYFKIYKNNIYFLYFKNYF